MISPDEEINAEIPFEVDLNIYLLFSILLKIAIERCCKGADESPNQESFEIVIINSPPLEINFLINSGNIIS